jgi:cytidine deaminase
MTNDELIQSAASVVRPHVTAGGRLFGDVGAALVSANGALYNGICLDTPSWGIRAERSAIAAMTTAGEYRIAKIVAVWRDARDGTLSVLPPCGVCREFMRSIDGGNLDTDVVLGRAETSKLRDLLPRHAWPEPLA